MGETIKNGESPTLKHLRQLEATGEYLFHGSLNPIDVIEPRQPFSDHKPDGGPSVCAATDLDTALFMALFRGAQNIVKVPSRSGYRHTGNENYFYATAPLLQAVVGATAYVHVLPRTGFRLYRGNEMRSASPVTPTEIVPVTIRDFDHPVHEVPLEETQATKISHS